MKLSSLNKKLLRDFIRLRGQVTAIVLVAACGVAAFVAMRTNYYSMIESQKATYDRYRFGRIFATVKRAPEGVRLRLESIPGVLRAETRIVRDVNLDVEGLNEPATGRIISLDRTASDRLNGVLVNSGRFPEADDASEVLVSEAFALANGTVPGDTLTAIINGRRTTLRVTGIALSAEFVYAIRGGEIFPDSRRFGVLWMDQHAVARLFNMEGAFNDVSALIAGDADEAEVIARFDAVLDEYGGQGAYGRTSQPSHEYVTNEINELNTTGTFIPTIFLAVTAFLINLVLTRLVGTQRDQIAVLKAFGYGNFAVGWHYVKFAILTLVAGSLAGIGLGLWIGYGMTGLYEQFFRFPVYEFRVDPAVIILAFGIGIVAGVAGAASAVRRAVVLPPSEAMRPEPPARFRAGWAERLGLYAVISPAARIVVRNIARHPVKASLNTLGIALSVMMLVVSFYMYFDALERIIFVQFSVVQREDVSVFFNEPQAGSARYDLAAIEGVMRVEPFRVVPARLRNGNKSRRMAVTGLEAGTELRRLVDRDLNPVAVGQFGLVLTTKLAEILGVSPGDKLTLEVLEGSRPVREVAVAGTIDEMIGLSAYIDRSQLNAMLGESDAISGAYLKVDKVRSDAIFSRLKNTPTIAATVVPSSALKNFRDTIATTMYTSVTFIVIFASVIAIGVVYNGARISLSERSRELASLRVLGFTRREIGVMLLGEQGLLTAVAIPLGWVLGFGLCALLVKAVHTELIRLPLNVSPRTYLFAFLSVLGAAMVSALLVAVRLGRLDLVEALKTRE